jgi:hypothetical protein
VLDDAPDAPELDVADVTIDPGHRDHDVDQRLVSVDRACHDFSLSHFRVKWNHFTGRKMH